MSVIIKGHSAFEMSLVSSIKDVESPYIKFKNIYFKCKSIEDAGGTIFVKQKKGKWIFKDDLKQYFCSECGYPSLTYDDVYIYGMDLPNFCEECGADMRGEQE